MMNRLRQILGTIFGALYKPIAPYAERASDAIAPLREQLRARYQKLESRERTLLKVAGIVFTVFIAYNLVYSPLMSWRDSIDTSIETREHDMGNVQHLVDTYLERKKQLSDAEKNTVPIGKDFSLFSVIEKSLTTSVGHDKIASITPGADRKLSDGFIQYNVELKLQNVSLAQIVDALYGVKTLSAPVAVSDMHITRRLQDPHTYDVEITCIALAKSA
jgi:type II secretory pathway component PulM